MCKKVILKTRTFYAASVKNVQHDVITIMSSTLMFLFIVALLASASYCFQGKCGKLASLFACHVTHCKANISKQNC